MFALKTHQAHSRCLAASFCCVSMHTPFPGCLHHQKKKEKKKRLFMFWIQHTGLANLPLQPNRNKLFDFNWTKSEWRSKLYFLQRCSILLLHVVRLFQWLPFYERVICFFFFFFSPAFWCLSKSPEWRDTMWYPSVAGLILGSVIRA